MATTEDVVARISAKDDNASSTVRKVKEEIKDVEAAAKSATTSTLNWSGAFRQLYKDTDSARASLNRTVDRGIIGLTALTGGAVAWGLKTASSFELSRSAFGALLGDVSRGNELFNQLQSYNLDAPFDFRGIADAEQTLLQFGVSGDHALAVLKGLGDIASMTSNPTQNLQSMALALGQISSAGVMRAQDMNQLVQAGFPAYQLLVDLTGKTSAQIRHEMETGLTIPSAQFVDAVEKMQAATLVKYQGGAKKQNDTLVGQWSNFKDMLARELEAGIAPAVPDIKKELPVLAQSFADAITKVGPQLPGLVQSAVELTPALVQVTGAFADLLTHLAPIVEDVSHLMGPHGVEALLVTLLGFRALSGVVGAVTTFAGALRVLRAAEEGGAAAGVAGVAGGAKTRRGNAAIGVATAAAPFFVDHAVEGYKKGGGQSDGFLGWHKWFGGSVGMAIHSGVTAAQWAGGAAEDNWQSPWVTGGGSDQKKRSGSGGMVMLNGGVTIVNPQNDIDVGNALDQLLRQREGRK